jgi:tetratricopeptide (TPR) repeat protein/TolB-like protein
MALSAGTRLGVYEIGSLLGAGGMGEVYLGYDPRLARRVALKCLTSTEAGSPEGHARIMREARAVARLTHANIAGVYDVLEEQGRTYIVMEYVEGVSLSAHIAGGPRPPVEVRALGRQLASALAAAHAHGVVHRDLKPANIQVMHDGSIKVLDFGVAKLASSLAHTVDATTGGPAADATVAGNPGTPIYNAPEQLAGRPADVRSDIYSAGVVLFQVSTGRRPYLETSAVPLALAMNAAPAPEARSINPLVPIELSDTIARLLERNPDDRMQSARELEAALGAMSGTASATRPVTGISRALLPRRWRRRLTPRIMWRLGAAAAALAVAAMVARAPLMSWLGWPRSSSVPARRAVVAIMPVDNPSGEIRGDYLGTGIAELVAENFGSIPGLTVLPRSSTVPFRQRRDDSAALQRELGATHVIELTMRGIVPRLVVYARLRRPGAEAADWEQVIEGDVLVVEQTLLERLGRALERGVLPHRLTATEWTRVRALPTSSATALQSYSEARALLDRADVPGNVDRAIELLTQATHSDPRFAAAYAALGDAQWARYQNVDRRPEVAAQATAAVMEALKINPDLAPVHYSLGNMQFQTGRYQEAFDSLRRGLAIQPDSDDSHRLLGRVMVARGDVDGGLAEIRKAIDVRPYWNNYYTLGYTLYMTGRYREAIDALTKTTELQPTFSNAYQMLGITYHMLGDLPQAIGNYEHAARLGPNAAAYANLALAYYAAGRYEQARNTYLEAIKRDERKATLRRDLGDVYTRLGRTAEAHAMYEKAIALAQDDLKVNPRDAKAVALIAVCEAKTGQRPAAERHAAEAVVLAPTDRDVRMNVAKAYVVVRNRSEGLRALQAAIALGYEPKMARDDDELELLRESSEFEKAIAAGLAARSQPVKGANR